MDFKEAFQVIGKDPAGKVIFVSEVFNNKGSALKCYFEYYKKMKKYTGNNLRRRNYFKDNFILETKNGQFYTGQINEIGV